MGVVTVSYVLGAVIAPGLFDLALDTQGFSLAMLSLASALLGVRGALRGS